MVQRLFPILGIAAVVLSAVHVSTAGVFAEEPPNELQDDASGPDDFDEIPAADNIAVIYQGTLQNEAGEPVSGVFPLSFHLYRGSMSADPIWSEHHFVSVVDGRYQIPLGHQTELREYLLDGQRWLGVELDGEVELLRDRLSVDRPDVEPDHSGVDGERVSHAEVAERATEAERARLAENALSLDGMSAEDIEDKANLALRRLGDHIADPDAHQAVTGPSVGGRTQTVDERAGGTGGSAYDIRCPEDYVAVGIEGSAGRVVDSITVICSPLE